MYIPADIRPRRHCIGKQAASTAKPCKGKEPFPHIRKHIFLQSMAQPEFERTVHLLGLIKGIVQVVSNCINRLHIWQQEQSGDMFIRHSPREVT